MGVQLVTYDLNRETVRPKIVKFIDDTYEAWARLSESSYAVATNEAPSQTYRRFQHLLDSNDQLYVITLKQPWDGQGAKDVNEWLEDRLQW